MKLLLLSIIVAGSAHCMEKNEYDLKKDLKAKVAIFDDELIVANPKTLKEMPSELSCMSKLIALSLRDNAIERIEHCDNLRNLMVLDLNGNQITEIPEHISVMTHLGALSVKLNKIARIDQKIAFLSYLQTVDLSENQLTELPHLWFLPNLRCLDLSNNQLTTIEKQGVCVLPQSLQTLNLENNQLTQLPSDFDKLTRLTSLDLSGNPISRLPEAFTNLQALSKLRIDQNLLGTDRSVETICKNSKLTLLHVKIN